MFGFQPSQVMTNDFDAFAGNKLLSFSNNLNLEVAKFKTHGGKPLEMFTSHLRKMIGDESTSIGKAKNKMLNAAILELQPKKEKIDKTRNDPNEIRKNLNLGLDANGNPFPTPPSDKDKSGASVSGDGNKVRNLSMHLQINNNFKIDDGNQMDKVKRKITDVIVDAARDGMVNIGV